MPACGIKEMDVYRLKCKCGAVFEPNHEGDSRPRRQDSLLDKWNVHRAGKKQAGR